MFNHSESLLFLLDRLLTRHGYRVTTHLQQRTSLEEIRALQPDLILLGHFQGIQENEYEIVRALRREPDLTAIPILIATTSTTYRDRIAMLQEQYVTVIEKPFDASDLLARIRQVLAENGPQA